MLLGISKGTKPYGQLKQLFQVSTDMKGFYYVEKWVLTQFIYIIYNIDWLLEQKEDTRSEIQHFFPKIGELKVTKARNTARAEINKIAGNVYTHPAALAIIKERDKCVKENFQPFRALRRECDRKVKKIEQEKAALALTKVSKKLNFDWLGFRSYVEKYNRKTWKFVIKLFKKL